MGNHNDSKKIIIKFNYESSEIIKIECNINDKLKKAINKFAKMKNVEITNLIFLYNGKLLDSDESISNIINSSDKISGEINILAYLNNPESNDINILLIIDSQTVIKLKGKKDDILETILQKENSIISSNLDKFEFLYKDTNINLDKTFEDIADEYDKSINRLIIYANHKEKFAVKFINDKLEEKIRICFPNDKMDDIIIKYCYENGNLNPNYYFFKYENNDNIFGKTINELYNDSNELNNNNNLTTNTSIKNISQTNTEFKEIEIKVIEKSCWQKYKFLIISIIIGSLFSGIISTIAVYGQKKK